MDKAFVKKMELMLKKEQARLREELGSFASKSARKTDDFNTRFPNYGDTEDDNAGEVADFQNNLSLENDLEKQLAGVDGALDRIKKGGYGKCSVCGKEIDKARLEAYPAATECINCLSSS